MMTVNAGLNLKAETKFYSFYYVSWAVRDTIIELGMIFACILAIYQISNGAPIGNFVMLVSYWANFTGICLDSIKSVALADAVQESLAALPTFRVNWSRIS